MIGISIRDFAEFVISGAARQRTILRRIKHPDEQSPLFYLYYSEARRLLREYHTNGHSKSWLQARADWFLAESKTAKPGKNIHLRNIARVLHDYHQYFAHRVFHPVGTIRLRYEHSSVLIKVTPDLYAKENGKLKIVKLEFGSNAIDPEMGKIISQIMFEATQRTGISISAKDILVFDISRGDVVRGARLGSVRKKNIEAVCANIEAIWPTI